MTIYPPANNPSLSLKHKSRSNESPDWRVIPFPLTENDPGRHNREKLLPQNMPG